ncbi:MAG: sodium:solute symporter family protein [Lentisphaeria bacterium]|nr:sodium:solute symporter family protein [Lentisphaeria bacterium]
MTSLFSQIMLAAAPVLNAEGEAMIHLDTVTRNMLWIGIGIYVATVLAIGWFSGRKVKNLGDFIVAGRRLPLWMATATLLATWFGAGSSMGVAATVYSGDLRDVIADPFGASISLILAGVFVVGVLRKLNCMTVTDIIQKKYGRSAGIYASLWLIPVYIGWLGAQVLGLGTLLNLLTGIDLFYARIIGAAVVLFYTVTGGMWAVTITDVVQVVLIVAGLFIIVPGAVQMSGGLDAVLNNPAADLSLAPAADTAGKPLSIVNYIGSWIIMGLGCMVGQDLIQRSLASKDDKVAISSSVISGFLYFMIALIPITIGLAAKILLPKWGITAEVMGGTNLSNQVLPRVAIGVMGAIHPVLLTLFISALISAIMSSADSSLLAASSLLVNNVIYPLRPEASEKSILLFTRIATVLLLVIATFLAMKVESIYALMVSCWSSQLVVVFIPVIAAIYFPKASGNTIWCTMIVSTSVWLAYIFITGMGIPGTFTEKLAAPEFEFQLTNGAVFGFAAGVTAFIASFMGELISAKCNRSAEKEFKKNRKKQRKAERKAQNKLEMAD